MEAVMPRNRSRVRPGAPGDYWKHDRRKPRVSWWRRIFGFGV
jgi:hypothetical protein